MAGIPIFGKLESKTTDGKLLDFSAVDGAPLSEQDLSAADFTPVANTYYKHAGATSAAFTNGLIYFYNGTDYKPIDGSGSGLETVSEDINNLSNKVEALETTIGEKSAVAANPTLEGTETELTGLTVDGTSYKVPSGGEGTTVEANPNSSASTELTKIKVADTIYSVSNVKAVADEERLKTLSVDGTTYKVSPIKRAAVLPDTVDDDTADVWVIGVSNNQDFYVKSWQSLTVEPGEVYCHDTTYSTDGSDTWTLTASGGTGEYTWGTNSEYVQLSATAGSEITVSLSVPSSNENRSGTITCTSGSQTVEIPAEMSYHEEQVCLTGDTLITMFNGSTKRIDEIKIGDEILSFNTRTGLLEKDIVRYSDSDQIKTYDHYDKYTFDDGTVIKVVHRHRFYNADFHKMVHMDSWEIGERAFKQNGTTPKLIKKEEGIMEETRHYTIFTKNQNYFANGLLAGNRFTKTITKG